VHHIRIIVLPPVPGFGQSVKRCDESSLQVLLGVQAVVRDVKNRVCRECHSNLGGTASYVSGLFGEA